MLCIQIDQKKEVIKFRYQHNARSTRGAHLQHDMAIMSLEKHGFLQVFCILAFVFIIFC